MTYYVNGEWGSDANSGLTPFRALKSWNAAQNKCTPKQEDRIIVMHNTMYCEEEGIRQEEDNKYDCIYW